MLVSLCSKWNYALHVTENHSLLLGCFNHLNSQKSDPPGDLVRQLWALPTHLGGLGLINPLQNNTIHQGSSVPPLLIEWLIKSIHWESAT